MIIKSETDLRVTQFSSEAQPVLKAANDNVPLDVDKLLEEIEEAANDNEPDEDLSGLGIGVGIGAGQCATDFHDEAVVRFTRRDEATELDFSEERSACRGFLAE